jgi:hypothetical protein
MKKIGSVLLLLGIMITFTACGGGGESTDDPNLGKYIGDQVEILDWEPIDEVYGEGENYVELKAGGKGTFCLDGDSTGITWKLDGENLTMTADGMDCIGTLVNGVITTDFFGMGISMTFIKEGASAPENSTAPDSSTPPDDETDGEKAVSGDGGMETYTVGADNAITLSYPSDTFFFDEDAILDTIAAKDDSVKIAIVPQISKEDHEGTMEYYDSYEEYEQYSTKDLTVGGYSARMITYYDSFFGYNAEVHVDFGKELETASYYGVNFSVSSEESLEACTDDAVMAIIQSLKTAG